MIHEHFPFSRLTDRRKGILSKKPGAGKGGVRRLGFLVEEGQENEDGGTVDGYLLLK